MKPLSLAEAEKAMLIEGMSRESRNDSLFKALRHFIPESLFPVTRKSVTILDLACGQAEEAGVLASYFSTRVLGLPSSSAKVIGIEILGSYVEYASEIHRNPIVSPGKLAVIPNTLFLQGDATDLSKYSAIPDIVDIVFLRHPEVLADKKVWKAILGQGLRRVCKEGLFIISVFHESENEAVQELLKELGAEVIKNAKNPHAIPLKGEPGFMGDKWMTVCRRKK